MIKLEDINLIFIRNYFKRTSAIEIFTKNKSYYFNFNEILSEKHPIIKLFNEIKYFQKIKINFKKNLGFYYNKNQENILFSFLSEEFPDSIGKRLNLINRYDLLVLLNLLANRSFNDLYQYPVFPILYKLSGILDNKPKKERDLSNHLGLQGISKNSVKRMEMVQNLDNGNYKEKSKENYIFNIHYSNPSIFSNYLIRVFPYSLTNIEIHGGEIDSPNRQFYSMEELFLNKNQLKLGTLSSGEEINDIYIKEKDEDNLEKYNYVKELKNYLLYDKELNINSWIDLIFGVNQEKSKEIRRDYYSKNKYIHLNIKDQLKEIKNQLNLDSVEFGVQPFKILDKNFSYSKMKELDSDYSINRLINYYLDEFYSTHLVIKNNKDICFLFEWNEYLNYQRYINYLTSDNSGLYDLKLPNYSKYLFKGNVLGDIIITQIKIDIKNSDYLENNDNSTNFSKTFLENIHEKKQDSKVYELFFV